MTRDQMELTLTLRGWAPQTDLGYHHLTNAAADQCVFVFRPEVARSEHVSVMAAAYAPSADEHFDPRWQAIPDTVFNRLLSKIQEIDDADPA